MSAITKDQAKDLRNAFQCWQQDYDPAEDKEQYDMFGLGIVAMDALLASLEAEPVAYVDPHAFHNFSVYRAGETDNKRMGREWMWANHDAGLIPVYTAPPAPASVPAAMEMDDDFDSAFEHGKAVGWNAYRAAMLQGAYGNSPVIPEGWVSCSERIPGEVLAALQNAARLRRNLNDFCGDRSLIAKCLSEAEEALLNAVNRHSTMLAEPLKEAKNV